MNQQQHTKPPITHTLTAPILQRRCACGKPITANGECAACNKKRGQIHRKATNQQTPEIVPPIVHEVLRESGRPLDSAFRAFMEPRFGYNFSQVRVHTNRKAAQSANTVNAQAYTVGHNVVFNSGHYQPRTNLGRRLLAHELVHVVQQQGYKDALQPTLLIGSIDDAHEIEADRIADQVMRVPEPDPQQQIVKLRQPIKLARIPDPDLVTLTYPNGRIETRRIVRVCDDGRIQFDPIGSAHVSAFQSIAYKGGVLRGNAITPETLQAFHRAIGMSPERCVRQTSQEVTLTFQNGLVERRRVIKICSNGVLHFEPRGHAHISNFRSIAYEGGVLTSVTPATLGSFYQALGMRPMSCPTSRGVGCTCNPSTRTNYDGETYQFIGSIKKTIMEMATRRGVPATAVAGSIADEYNTRRGVRSVVDGLQDFILDMLPEAFIGVDRFFDINSKLLNALENDIGAANINVRTALELVQREELSVPGSPPTDAQVSEIINFLLTERGTVEASAAVIRRAQGLFARSLWGYPQVIYDAVLVTYFKQGDRYYNRATENLRTNPDHEICPGDGGCRFQHNWRALDITIRRN